MDETRDIIKSRIDCLVAQINDGSLSKKQRKEIGHELNGYGIILLRAGKKNGVTLKVGTNILKNFEIDGTEETQTGTIIGYICGKCLATSTVKDLDTLAVRDQFSNILTCLVCDGYNIQPIYDNCIIL